MKLPANPWQNLSPPQRIIFILASLCVVGLIALAALVLELRSRQQEALPQAGSIPMQRAGLMSLNDSSCGRQFR